MSELSEHEASDDSPRRGRDAAGLTTQLVVLGWCLWIAGSWGLALLNGSLLPAARWLVVQALVGLMLVWPAVRLSWPRGSVRRLRPAGVWGEWLALMLVLQAVIWPVRLIAQWRVDQALWVAATLAAWSLLTAALVAVGVHARACGARALVMFGCVALVVGEPAALALAVTAGWTEGWPMQANPLVPLWALMQPAVDVGLGRAPGQVMLAAAAAVAAWLVVALTTGRRP